MPENEIVHNLTRYYREHRPDLFDPQVSMNWVNTTGWESEIYAYTLTSGKPGQHRSVQRILRLLTGGSAADAAREYQFLALLHKAGYPVPEVYGLGQVDVGLGYPFIIMQRIEGGSFASRFISGLAENSPSLAQFITLFRRLHTLDWHPYVEKPGTFEKPGDPYFHFDRVLAQYQHHLSQGGLHAFERVMAWLKDRRRLTACPESSIVHLDFHHNNILEDVNGKLFVIDWTSAEISDYRLDLAWTLTLALAYRGETGRRLILEEYQRHMGQAVPALEVFEVVAILRRIGTVMISITAGPEILGMRPEAAEVMRQDREPLSRLYTHLQNLTGLELLEIGEFLEALGQD